MGEMRKIAIVGSARIPFQRAYTGYADESNLTMLGTTLAGLADKFNLKGEAVGEVMGGAVISHSRDFNVAREAALDAGFSPRTPGTNLQIACGTSLQAALNLGAKIATGEIESGIACGTDTVSDSPIVFGTKFQHRLVDLNRAKTPQEKLAAFKGFNLGELTPVAPSTQEPRTGLSMGEHCELMATHWGITRAEQDELALASHKNAAKAYEQGFRDPNGLFDAARVAGRVDQPARPSPGWSAPRTRASRTRGGSSRTRTSPPCARTRASPASSSW